MTSARGGPQNRVLWLLEGRLDRQSPQELLKGVEIPSDHRSRPLKDLARPHPTPIDQHERLIGTRTGQQLEPMLGPAGVVVTRRDSHIGQVFSAVVIHALGHFFDEHGEVAAEP